MIFILVFVAVGTIFFLGALAGGSLQSNRADRRRRHARNVQLASTRRTVDDRRAEIVPIG